MRKVTQFMQDFNLTDKKFAPMEKALVRLCKPDNSELIARGRDLAEILVEAKDLNWSKGVQKKATELIIELLIALGDTD